MMRVLLFSCNTGEGHNSTAKAIMAALEKRGISCDLQDSLAYLSPGISKFISNWHTRIYCYAPKLFDMGYRAMEHTVDPEETTLVYEMLKLGSSKVAKMLTAGNYDAILCTHTFSAMLLTEVRRSWGLGIPSYFVATDYTCSPTVEQSELDGYFIPHSTLSGEFVRAGIPSWKLLPTGIPVHSCFYEKHTKAEARECLHIGTDQTVILLMGGSMGCGPIRQIAQELTAKLPENALVVAICGNNEKLYEAMEELAGPRLRVLGFTQKLEVYMDAADLIVTKPGGLSSTEAANKHLPMVLFNTVGGCESRNIAFFLRRGYAEGSSDAQKVVEKTLVLAQDLQRRQKIIRALEEDFVLNSTEAIVKYVLDGAKQYRLSRDSILLEKNGYPSKEGGCSMDESVKTRTLQNLARSFAGESQARTRYTIYAQVARKEGYEWIARVFEETAANEAVHAEEFLEHIQKLGGCTPNIDLDAGYPFQLGTTAENLQYAAHGELEEHDSAYPAFAEAARREDCDETARLWLQIARIEGVHHNAFKSLHEQLVSDTLTQKEAPIVWRCLNCGYTYEGIRACDPCPVCGKSAGWQEGELNRKEMIPKK